MSVTHYRETDDLTELLIGRKVEKVDDETLRLDDGRILRIVPNEGGCSCGAGDYVIAELNGCDNIITRVEQVEEAAKDGDYAYRVFVYAENRKINLLSVEGDDGNGYYGTGYEITVRDVTA